jgi:UDP-N-acetylmuramate dehydrogenase
MKKCPPIDDMRKVVKATGSGMLTGVPVTAYNTARTGGIARAVIRAENADCLKRLMSFSGTGEGGLKVLGRGSNVLFPDGNVNRVPVLLSGSAFQAVSTADRYVRAGAGVPLGRLISECASAGLAGMEGLAGIPGTVGGALVMNASYKSSISDFFRGAVLMRPDGSITTVRKEEADFSYRGSSFGNGIILEAEFVLEKEEPGRILARLKRLFREKMSSQPLGERTLGCVFKNPGGGLPSSGALIDRSGLKGTVAGGAMVSEKHANFIINRGGASSSDFLELMALIKNRVRMDSGVELQTEIEVIE